MARNNQLEKLRSIIVRMINDEQDDYSDLLDRLQTRVGALEDQVVFKSLELTHDAKVDTLRDILEEIKKL